MLRRRLVDGRCDDRSLLCRRGRRPAPLAPRALRWWGRRSWSAGPAGVFRPWRWSGLLWRPRRCGGRVVWSLRMESSTSKSSPTTTTCSCSGDIAWPRGGDVTHVPVAAPVALPLPRPAGWVARCWCHWFSVPGIMPSGWGEPPNDASSRPSLCSEDISMPPSVATTALGRPCQQCWCTFTLHSRHRRHLDMRPMLFLHTRQCAVPIDKRGCSSKK